MTRLFAFACLVAHAHYAPEAVAQHSDYSRQRAAAVELASSAFAGLIQLQRYILSLLHVHSRLLAAALVSAMMAGCGSSGPGPVASSAYACRSPHAMPLKTHVHANGLQLSVSETCQVTMTPVGFVIEPPDSIQLRYRFRISIQLLANPPESKGDRSRSLGAGRMLWYSTTHVEGAGYGDPDWEVLAFEHVDNRWIQYWQKKQGESVVELWEVAAGLRYVPSSSAALNHRGSRAFIASNQASSQTLSANE